MVGLTVEICSESFSEIGLSEEGSQHSDDGRSLIVTDRIKDFIYFEKRIIRC